MKKILVDDIIETGIDRIFSKESCQKFEIVYYDDLAIENIPRYYNILLKPETIGPELYEKNAFFLFTPSKQPIEAKLNGIEYDLVKNIFEDNDLEEIFEKFDIEPFIGNVLNPNLTNYIFMELNKDPPIYLPAAILYDKFGNKTLTLSGNRYSKDTTYKSIVNHIAIEDRIEWLTEFAEDYLIVKKNQYYLNLKKMAEFGIQILDPIVNDGTNYYHVGEIGTHNNLEENLSLFFRAVVKVNSYDKIKKYFDLPIKNN
ncbi:hypothetical protein HN415_07890 [Candidatus Woesearchaeota archaeon]|jgi:hypothetical protein|nr:hypothetical protein [Candidatus Woesearchaeota archaeon]